MKFCLIIYGLETLISLPMIRSYCTSQMSLLQRIGCILRLSMWMHSMNVVLLYDLWALVVAIVSLTTNTQCLGNSLKTWWQCVNILESRFMKKRCFFLLVTTNIGGCLGKYNGTHMIAFKCLSLVLSWNRHTLIWDIKSRQAEVN